MSKLNWAKASSKERATFIPSPRSEPSTQAQLNYIVTLCHQKGARHPHRMPLTKQGASNMIDRLKSLPDKPLQEILKPASPHQEAQAELRECLNLSPQTVTSLMHIFNQIDPVGTAFFLDTIMRDEGAPKEQDQLLMYILREFVTECAPTNGDAY